MKVLSIFGYFKLPDGFDGSLSDALRVMADYHDGVTEAGGPRHTHGTTPGMEEADAHTQTLFEEFIGAVEEGFRFHGGACVVASVEGEKGWRHMDPTLDRERGDK